MVPILKYTLNNKYENCLEYFIQIQLWVFFSFGHLIIISQLVVSEVMVCPLPYLNVYNTYMLPRKSFGQPGYLHNK